MRDDNFPMEEQTEELLPFEQMLEEQLQENTAEFVPEAEVIEEEAAEEADETENIPEDASDDDMTEGVSEEETPEGEEDTAEEAAEETAEETPEAEEIAEGEEITEGEEVSEGEDAAEGEEVTEGEEIPEGEEAPEGEIPAEEPPVEETLEQLESEASAAEESKEVPYHERYYLKYREGKRNTALDLEGTRSFLKELGFDGGELRQAREGKDCAESFRNADKNGGNQMRCSYCGAEISGVEFFRLPDGRLRCTTCSNSVVKTKEEVEEICQRVIANLDNFFGATIDVPVSFEITDERKLKRKVGVPVGTKDSQSMLILGVAVNKKNKYKVILENGAPRISLIATFAHELTHIWQYTHWDNNKNFQKCPKSKRLLIYEGMAKWVELQYLYMIGETNVARREEAITRKRQDEYGRGFCLYEEVYPLSRDTMNCDVTPFTPDTYPL